MAVFPGVGVDIKHSSKVTQGLEKKDPVWPSTPQPPRPNRNTGRTIGQSRPLSLEQADLLASRLCRRPGSTGNIARSQGSSDDGSRSSRENISLSGSRTSPSPKVSPRSPFGNYQNIGARTSPGMSPGTRSRWDEKMPVPRTPPKVSPQVHWENKNVFRQTPPNREGKVLRGNDNSPPSSRAGGGMGYENSTMSSGRTGGEFRWSTASVQTGVDIHWDNVSTSPRTSTRSICTVETQTQTDNSAFLCRCQSCDVLPHSVQPPSDRNANQVPRSISVDTYCTQNASTSSQNASFSKCTGMSQVLNFFKRGNSGNVKYAIVNKDDISCQENGTDPSDDGTIYPSNRGEIKRFGHRYSNIPLLDPDDSDETDGHVLDDVPMPLLNPCLSQPSLHMPLVQKIKNSLRSFLPARHNPVHSKTHPNSQAITDKIKKSRSPHASPKIQNKLSNSNLSSPGLSRAEKNSASPKLGRSPKSERSPKTADRSPKMDHSPKMDRSLKSDRSPKSGHHSPKKEHSPKHYAKVSYSSVLREVFTRKFRNRDKNHENTTVITQNAVLLKTDATSCADANGNIEGATVKQQLPRIVTHVPEEVTEPPKGPSRSKENAVREWVNNLPQAAKDFCRGLRRKKGMGTKDVATLESRPPVERGPSSEDDLSLGAEAKCMSNTEKNAEPKQASPAKRPLSASPSSTKRRLAWLKSKSLHGESFNSEISMQTTGSHISSVEVLLQERKGDPEQILLNLGFGNKQNTSNLACRVPERFLKKPSKADGIDVKRFLDDNQELAEYLEQKRSRHHPNSPAENVEDGQKESSAIDEIFQQQQADMPWIPGRFSESSLSHGSLHPSYAEYQRTRSFEGKKKSTDKIYSVLHPDNQLCIAEQGHYDTYPDYFKENVKRCVLGDIFSDFVLISRRFSAPGKPCLIRLDSDLNSHAVVHMMSSQESGSESFDSSSSTPESENETPSQNFGLPIISLEPVKEDLETSFGTASPSKSLSPVSPRSPRPQSPRIDLDATPTKDRSSCFNAMLMEAEKIRKARVASEGSPVKDGKRRARVGKSSPYKTESGSNPDDVDGAAESGSEPRRRRSGLTTVDPNDLSQLREEVELRERISAIGDERRKDMEKKLNGQKFENAEEENNNRLLPGPERTFGPFSPRSGSPTPGFEGLMLKKGLGTDIMAASGGFGNRPNRISEFDLDFDFEAKRKRFVSMSSESTDYSDDSGSGTPTDEFSHEGLFDAPLVGGWKDTSDGEDDGPFSRTLVESLKDVGSSESDSEKSEVEDEIEEVVIMEETLDVNKDGDYDIYYYCDEESGDEDGEFWDVGVQVELGPHTLVTAGVQIAALDLENVQTQTDLSLLESVSLHIDGPIFDPMNIGEKELNPDAKRSKLRIQYKLDAIKESSDLNSLVGTDMSTDEFSESGFCSMSCDLSQSTPKKSDRSVDSDSLFDHHDLLTSSKVTRTVPARLTIIDRFDLEPRGTEHVEDHIITKRIIYKSPSPSEADLVDRATDKGSSNTEISVDLIPVTDRKESKVFGNPRKVIQRDMEMDPDLEVELTMMGLFEYDSAPEVAAEVVIATSPGDVENDLEERLDDEEVSTSCFGQFTSSPVGFERSTLHYNFPHDKNMEERFDQQTAPVEHSYCVWTQDSDVDPEIFCADDSFSAEHLDKYSGAYEGLPYSPISSHDGPIDSASNKKHQLQKMSQSISLPNLRDPRFYCYEPEKNQKTAPSGEISQYLRTYAKLPKSFYSFHQNTFWLSAGDLTCGTCLKVEEPLLVSERSEIPVYLSADRCQRKQSCSFSISSGLSDQSECSVNSPRDECLRKRSRAFSITSNDGEGYVDSVIFLNTANQSETGLSNTFSTSSSGATWSLGPELNSMKVTSPLLMEDENRNCVPVRDSDNSHKDGNSIDKAVSTDNHVILSNHGNHATLSNQNIPSSSHVTFVANHGSNSMSNRNVDHHYSKSISSQFVTNSPHFPRKHERSSFPPSGGTTSPVFLEREDILEKVVKRQMGKIKGHNEAEMTGKPKNRKSLTEGSESCRVDSKLSNNTDDPKATTQTLAARDNLAQSGSWRGSSDNLSTELHVLQEAGLVRSNRTKIFEYLLQQLSKMGQNESGHIDPLDETPMDRGSYRRHSFHGPSSTTLDVKLGPSRSLSHEDLLRDSAGLKTLSGDGGTLRRDVLKRQQGLRRKDFSVNPRWSDPTPCNNVKREKEVKMKDELKMTDPRLTSSENLRRKCYTDLDQGQQLRYDSDDSLANIKKKRKKKGRSKNKESVVGNCAAASVENEAKTEHIGEMAGLLRNDTTEVKATKNAADIMTEPKVKDNKTEVTVTQNAANVTMKPEVKDNKTEIKVTVNAADVKTEPKVKVCVAADVKTGDKVVTMQPPGCLEVMKVSRSKSMSNVHLIEKASHNAPQQSLIQHPVLTQQTQREYDFQSLRQYYESLSDERGRSMTLPKETLARPIDGARLKRALSASDVHEIAKSSVIFHTPSNSSTMDVDLVHSDHEGKTKKKEKKKKKHKHHHRSREELDSATSGSEKAAPDVTLPDEAKSVRRETTGITVDIRSVKRVENDVRDVTKSEEVLLKSSGGCAAGNDAADGVKGAESFKTVDDVARFVNDQNETIEEISKASFASKVAIFEQSKHMHHKPGAHLEKKGLTKPKDYTDLQPGEFDAQIIPTEHSQVEVEKKGPSTFVSDNSAAHPGTVENVVCSVSSIRVQGIAQEVVGTSAASGDVNNTDACKSENIIFIKNSSNVTSGCGSNRDVVMENSDQENGHPPSDLMSIPSIEITYAEDVDQTENPEFVPLCTEDTNEARMANRDSSVGNTNRRDDSMDSEESRAAIVEDVIYQDMSVGGVFASPHDLDELASRSQENQKVRGQKDSVTFTLPPDFHEGADDLEIFIEGQGQGRDRTNSKDSVVTTVSSLSSSCSSGGFEDYMLENLAREQQTIGDVQKCGKGWKVVKSGAGDENSQQTLSKSNGEDSPSGDKKGSIDDASVTIATTEAAFLATESPRGKRPNSLEIGNDAELWLMTPPGVTDDDDMLIVLTGNGYASCDRRDQKCVLEALVLRDRSSSVKTPTTPLTPHFPPYDKNGVLSDFDLLDMSLVKYKADLKELEMLADVVYMDNTEKLSDKDRETLAFIASIHLEIYEEVTAAERQLLDFRGKVETIPIALEQECYLVANMMEKVISLLKEQLYHNGIIESLQEEYSPQLMSQSP
ncbi:uncharacterized protein LOC135499428 [Lineus longissimus]|uniref:uncharacterized protein LOC135499428 n=1 Tax=Lineus longissimus TaxID=88925 RepID=UPI00315D1084